jgi:preprotein translocase YajC subunit
MTPSTAVLHLLDATKKSTSSSVLPLVILVVIAIVGYFFFLKPQQRKAQAARAGQASGYEVGDVVQTIGGLVGTVLEINGDRFTLLTGSTDAIGNLEGAQPTRLVFVRQAIARKVDVIVEPDEDLTVEDDDVADYADHDHDGHDHEHDHDENEETEEA